MPMINAIAATRAMTIPICFIPSPGLGALEFGGSKRMSFIYFLIESIVPEAGLEPARGCPPGGLSPLRLPIPPLGQVSDGVRF